MSCKKHWKNGDMRERPQDITTTDTASPIFPCIPNLSIRNALLCEGSSDYVKFMLRSVLRSCYGLSILGIGGKPPYLGAQYRATPTSGGWAW